MAINRNQFFRTSDEAILYFEDHSPEKGDPIVLVPGFCCTTKFFEKNIPGLAQNHRVITFDPRGQGSSSKSLQGQTVRRNAQDIHELLDYLGVENAALLGWSMAGQLVMKYFELYGDERVSSLGLIDCPLGAMHDAPWNAHSLKGFNTALFNDHLMMSYNGWAEYCEFFAHMIFDGNDDSRVDWCAKELQTTPPWLSFAMYSDYVLTNGYEILPRVTVPMVFFGANGRVTANGKELAAKWYPENLNPAVYRESYTFETGGHVFFFCHPEEFNADLETFLRNAKKH